MYMEGKMKANITVHASEESCDQIEAVEADAFEVSERIDVDEIVVKEESHTDFFEWLNSNDAPTNHLKVNLDIEDLQ